MPKFYIYAIRDGAAVLYIGKGSGRRLAVQERKFGCSGEILERLASETKALAAERKWIAKLRPELNKCLGGNGGRVRSKRARLPAFVAQIERGSRGYAARLLLAAERAVPGIVDPSKVDAIRQVACGGGI